MTVAHLGKTLADVENNSPKNVATHEGRYFTEAQQQQPQAHQVVTNAQGKKVSVYRD